MSAAEIVLRSLAGLGLLFFGIKMVTRNLGAMAGDQLRRGIERVSRRAGVAGLFGALAGFVTQSGRTTAFLMASFVQAGLTDTRRALPVVLWSNFGCTLVIFAAIFPISLFALFLIAVTGVAVAFERPRSLVKPASAVLGLGLMLLGLQMMSGSAAALIGYPWFAQALGVIRLSLVFAFLVGLALTVVAQSHLAVMLIALSLAARGLFDFDQTLMVLYGAQAGSSLTTLVTGVHFRGQPRQVVMAQILYNLGGVALFLASMTIRTLVRLTMTRQTANLRVVIEDQGVPFDPSQAQEPEVPADLDQAKIGGLGVHLMRKLASAMAYERDGGVNRLTLDFTLA